MMIPKGPSVHTMIRSNGVQIEPVGVDRACIEEAARDILEWHITRKK